MAELDYAFLAQWAGVQGDGTLTSVGMSFTRVQTGELGRPFSFTVAGRVRGHVSEPNVDMTMTVSNPEGEKVRVSASLAMPPEAAYTVDGRTHALFALSTTLLLTSTGLYTVLLESQGQTWRELHFTVDVLQVAPQGA